MLSFSSFSKWLKYFSTRIEQWALPYRCLICKRASDQALDLCTCCADYLPKLSHSCLRCALPLPSEDIALCGPCLVNNTSPVDRTMALFNYHTPISEWIHAFKFHEALYFARIFGTLFSQTLKNKSSEFIPDILIPVPLHPQRLQERGFNQSAELGRIISEELNIPILYDVVQRTEMTTPQHTLAASQRARNLKNVFKVINFEKINNKHIAILDDVMTTGSTASALAHTLKKQGAKEISVWVIARTLLH